MAVVVFDKRVKYAGKVYNPGDPVTVNDGDFDSCLADGATAIVSPSVKPPNTEKTPAKTLDIDLSGLTVKELRDLAEVKGVDLGPATIKDEVIAILTQALTN